MKLTRHRPDFIMLVAVLLLISIGLLTIYSASIIYAETKDVSSHYFFVKQMIFTVVGFFVMFMIMNMPYWAWRKLLLLMIPASFVLLLAVFLFEPVNNAHRWIRIGSLTFQPSELATLTVIIYLSHLLDKKKDHIKDFKKAVIAPLVLVGIFSLEIIIEPDMDAAALIIATAFAILFAAGVPILHLAKLIVPAAGLAAFLVLNSFRKDRVLSFLDPFSEENFLNGGYQQANSLYAIASGGWLGRGLGRSVEKFGYLPEPHTDFIFSIFLEEWGTIGGIALILLFAILIWRAIRIVSYLPDRFGALMAVGITCMIGFAVLANIGMVTGSFPVMGIPLPFITYGGSALVMKMAAMGILLNLSRYTTEEPTAARR